MFTAKWVGQLVTPLKEVTSKGRDVYPYENGKLCYYAININYVLVLICMQNYENRAQSVVCHDPS